MGLSKSSMCSQWIATAARVRHGATLTASQGACERGPVIWFRGDPHHDLGDAIEGYYRNVLGEYLASRSDSALMDAVDAFAEPIEQAFREPAPGGEPSVETLLWDAWYYVITTAINPDDSVCVKLIDLVLALQRRGRLTRESDGRECLVWGGRVWDELPLFGPQTREAWNDVFTDYPASYLNSVSFAARLTAASSGENAAIDFSAYATWDFRDALELTREEREERGRFHGPDELLIGIVRWLSICGPVLASLAAEHAADDGADFSVPRWTRWRERLAALAAGPEPTAAAARIALTLMPTLA